MKRMRDCARPALPRIIVYFNDDDDGNGGEEDGRTWTPRTDADLIPQFFRFSNISDGIARVSQSSRGKPCK